LSIIKESLDEQISPIFKEAKSKLEEINQEEYKKKRDIVIDLAKKLEDIISQTDTICKMIINRLDGKVSGRFIRQCLSAKYKQEHRRKNAKKQKKNYHKESKLAAKTPLNPEEEEEKQKDKVSVMVGVDGSAYTQIKEDNSTETEFEAHTDSPSKDKIFTQSFFSSQQQLEQKNPIEECVGHLDNELKVQRYDDLDYQNLEQEVVLDKPFQVTTTNENRLILPEDKSISTSNISADILPFELSWSFKEVRNYLAPLYRTIGDNGRVWFNGKINKKTGYTLYPVILEGSINNKNNFSKMMMVKV
jgi:hypothetical protein